MLVRASGLDPDRVRDQGFRANFNTALLTAVGPGLVASREALKQPDPKKVDTLLLFKEEAASTRRMQSIAEAGELTVTLPCGETVTCLAVLRAARMRPDEVQLVMRGIPLGWGRVGLASHILACAGYPQGVVRESAGALPAREAILFPHVTCGDILVAVVKPPPGDRGLRNLPRKLVSSTYHLS